MKALVLFILGIASMLNLQANRADIDSVKKCGIIVWDGEKASFVKTLEFDKQLFSVEFEGRYTVSGWYLLYFNEKKDRSISSTYGIFIFDQVENCIYAIKGNYCSSSYPVATYMVDIIEPKQVVSIEVILSNDYADLMDDLDRVNKTMIDELREARLKTRPENK